jgi:hypothetical protein
MVISFGLEAHIFGMRPELFWRIVTNDRDGTNSDPAKRSRLRTFLIPDEYIVDGSSTHYPRTINIFAAFISNGWVYVLTDFARLVRMHIISRDAIWTKDDFVVGSPVCLLLCSYSLDNLSNLF